MPEAIPHMDYEMLARYEWFRRSFWGQSEQAWLIPIFHALVREHGCASCLFACGALGRVALAFAKQSPGTALFAYLPSAYGAERMRELAKAEGVSCSFLFGNRAEIAGNLPHPVDCVFSPNWMSEPDWNVLKTHFENAFPEQPNLYQDAATKEALLPILCNHCDKPPCVRVVSKDIVFAARSIFATFSPSAASPRR